MSGRTNQTYGSTANGPALSIPDPKRPLPNPPGPDKPPVIPPGPDKPAVEPPDTGEPSKPADPPAMKRATHTNRLPAGQA